MAEFWNPAPVRVIDHFDVRHGGTWRYRSLGPTGDEYSFRSVFHGTPSPDGITQTFEFEDMPGHVCLETVTFAERGEVALLTQRTVFACAADGDAALESNVAEGSTSRWSAWTRCWPGSRRCAEARRSPSVSSRRGCPRVAGCRRARP